MRITIFGVLVLAGCGGGDAPSGPDAAGGADAAPCSHPLDTTTLENLTHSAWAVPAIELQPGTDRDVNLGTVELGGAFSVVDACATWSIVPASGASVDPATGVIHADAGTASGTRYVVSADVESGRRVISADVVVYTQAAMPWHGAWREVSEYACGTGAEVAPEQTINEIYFWAEGTLWVTWTPFEVYVDYWGHHQFDPGAGTVALTPDGGNYIPADVDGTGGFSFDGDDLVLHDVWLGSPQSGTGPARCGHKLSR